MTDLAKIFLGGAGALIALYIMVKYGDGFAKAVNSAGSVIVNETKTLQGN